MSISITSHPSSLRVTISSHMADSPNPQVTTTTVPYLLPTTTTVSQRSPNILGTRILSIDLDVPAQRTSLDLDKIFLAKVKDAVLANTQASPFERFDTLIIGPTDSDTFNKELFDALDGISPKHLEVFDGLHEYCDLQCLSIVPRLKFPWTKLESMKVSALNPSISKNGHFPENIFSRITYLDLEYTCSNSFTGLTNLKKLRAFMNRSMDTFVTIFDNNPIAKVLEKLEISSPHPFDLFQQYSIKDFRARLKQCNRLQELKLRMNTSYDTGYVSCIPQSLEKLEFCGSTSPHMLRDLGTWIHSAKQPTWLPRLKFTCVRFDIELNDLLHGQSQNSVEMAKLEKQRDILYRILEAREPPVLTLKWRVCIEVERF